MSIGVIEGNWRKGFFGIELIDHNTQKKNDIIISEFLVD